MNLSDLSESALQEEQAEIQQTENSQSAGIEHSEVEVSESQDLGAEQGDSDIVSESVIAPSATLEMTSAGALHSTPIEAATSELLAGELAAETPESELESSPSATAELEIPVQDFLSHPAHPGLRLQRVLKLKSNKKKAKFKKAKPKVASADSRPADGSSEASETLERVDETKPVDSFESMGLPTAIEEAIKKSGYAEPSQIQAAIIPPMLAGRDIVAQSQTGSGKTAAFALPVLANLKTGKKKKKNAGPQVLVLAPTRELAMQVAASFSTYAGELPGFSVAAIYGGQDYEPQNRALRSGVSVIVGTPGRVIDHVKRGSLNLDALRCLVLDEADEMLNMGFLEDVEFVLEQCPDQRQIALFSATMPEPIRRIADRYLNDPHTVTIQSKAMTAESIRQRAILCRPKEKMELLYRVLEAETTDGVIVFAKTKESTTVIADKLAAAGHKAAALNGDMPQATRQRVVGSLKKGKLDILVATDVAARGLDVPRISHVINFDLPHDRESYVHRIGRTGRAGRSGEAILLLAPSARGRLRSIEQMTKQKIEIAEWPTAATINDQRIENFKQQISGTLAERDVTFFEKLIAAYVEESGKPVEKVAAALAQLSCKGRPFLLQEREAPKPGDGAERRSRRQSDGEFGGRSDRPKGGRGGGPVRQGMGRYRVEVGRVDGVRPGNLVGAIANEAGIDSQYIGPIQIQHDFTIVDLPAQMPDGAFQTLQQTRVMGKPLRISVDKGPGRRGGGGSSPHGGRRRGPGDSSRGGGPRGKSGGPKRGFQKGKKRGPK